MKKIWGWVVGVVLVAVIGAYIIWGNMTAAPTTATVNNIPPNDGIGNNSSTASTTTGGGSTGGTTATGQYKDGIYTGPVTDAIYGQLEVVVTIQNGKIVDTECPIQPDAPGHTTEVNASALPQLKQEAIASQSANVNIISGATQTSQAYQQSLTVALAQAKA